MIQKGSKIKVHYTGTLEDGAVFDSSEGNEPLEFEVGAGQLISGFDTAVIGMKQGEEKTVKIPPEQAYGNHEEGLTKKIPRESLPKERDPEVGMVLGLSTPDGQQIPTRIIEVTPTDVTIDLNHPLAGKNAEFQNTNCRDCLVFLGKTLRHN